MGIDNLSTTDMAEWFANHRLDYGPEIVSPDMMAWGRNIFMHPEQVPNMELLENQAPYGSIWDFTDGTEFAEDMQRMLHRKTFTALDLGTSTGNVPLTMRKVGVNAVGLEGSIHPGQNKVGAWAYDGIATLCDLEQPWNIVDNNGHRVLFDVITSWEVIEHIAKDRLDSFFTCIANHMHQDAVFIGSVNLVSGSYERDIAEVGYDVLGMDIAPTNIVELHKTIEPYEWWIELLSKYFIIEPLPPLVRPCRCDPHSFIVWAKL